MKKILARFHIYLSHHSYLYALIVGIGIVLFWRGVWHTVDLFHVYINARHTYSMIDLAVHPWWDGPLSLFVGCFVLYCTKAFISSFIGNELILSGLRSEERLTKKAEHEIKTEEATIVEIKDEITMIAQKLSDLETQVKTHHLK